MIKTTPYSKCNYKHFSFPWYSDHKIKLEISTDMPPLIILQICENVRFQLPKLRIFAWKFFLEKILKANSRRSKQASTGHVLEFVPHFLLTS